MKHWERWIIYPLFVIIAIISWLHYVKNIQELLV